MTGTPFNLLAIDDDEEDLHIFSEAVARIGPPLTCRTSPDCREAIELLESGTITIDMIFLDAYMDNMNGLDCLRYLKEHKELSFIPVVMLAGIRNERIYQKAMRSGALNYFQKPGEMKEVVALIKSVLPFKL